jgi:hypothetical protein
MWLFFIQFFISIVIWIIANFICEKYPFTTFQTEIEKLKPFDYYRFYSSVYMGAFLIIVLILQLF